MSQSYRTRMDLQTIAGSTLKHADKIDMRFKYTPAASTDIRETFDRVRREWKKSKLKGMK